MIFGADDRVPVADTRVLPASAVVQIITRFPNGLEEESTGLLIGPNDVLTAAHVLYEASFGGHVELVLVTPGLNGSLAPFGDSFAISIQVHPDWISVNDRDGLPLTAFDHDLAMITLDRPVGYETGFLPYGVLDDPLGRTVQSIGYPGDLGGDVPVQTSGTIDDADAETLLFDDDFDAAAGQSGSPVFDGDRAIGIFSHNSVEPPFYNGALRLTAEFVQTIDLWRTTNDETDDPDFILGGVWSEVWFGQAGDDRIFGREGDDTLYGGDGADEINGNAGDDLLDGESGPDAALGGQGDDVVEGRGGDDWHLNGNRGDDLVFGGLGSDQLFGGPDQDRLDGGQGADTLSGDRGDDTLVGGLGADVYAFAAESGDDRIEGFAPADGDRIRLVAGVNGSGIGTAADALTRLVAVEGGSRLDLGGDHAVLLAGIAPAAVDATAFWVV